MRRGAFGALCLWLAALPAAAAEPGDWLQRIAAAHASQHYDGTVVVLRGDQLEALRVSHRAGADAGRTRLQSLTGEPRSIRRSGGFAELQAGSEAMPRVGLPPRGDAGPASLRHYRISPVGRDRVAGLASDVIEILPRDVFRYGYRLWLDQEHGLPLKSAAFGADGRLVEQWMFAEIRFRTEPADDGVSDAPAAPVMQASPLRPADARWQVRDLPPGFELLAVVESSARGEHQLFGDGWARVSLYVEPMSTQQPGLSGLLQRGATSLFGRALDGRQITVVGEVPPITVERIAQGVVARDGA